MNYLKTSKIINQGCLSIFDERISNTPLEIGRVRFNVNTILDNQVTRTACAIYSKESITKLSKVGTLKGLSKQVGHHVLRRHVFDYDLSRLLAVGQPEVSNIDVTSTR